MIITITKDGRRKKYISNAVYEQALERASWFNEIDQRIKIDIKNNPCKQTDIILKWIKSCEEVGSEIVRNEILKRYRNDGYQFNY